MGSLESPGIHAAGGRRHDVRDQFHRAAIRVRARREDRRDEVEARAGDCPATTWRRCAAAWTTAASRYANGKSVLRPSRRQARGARCQDRQGLWTVTVADYKTGHAITSAAAGRQGPRGHRHRRRRVRHPRLRAGATSRPPASRSGRPTPSRARASRATRPGRAIRGRRAAARPGAWLVRSRSATWSTGPPATPDRGARRPAVPTPATFGQYHEPVDLVAARVRRGHRQDRLGLPVHAARRVGLRRHQRRRADRPEHRRQADAGADARGPQRLLLRPQPRQRQAGGGGPVRARSTGRRTSTSRPAGRSRTRRSGRSSTSGHATSART